MANDPEKNIGSKPTRATSLQVADGVSDPDQYTLSKRPWRLRATPFSEILRQVCYPCSDSPHRAWLLWPPSGVLFSHSAEMRGKHTGEVAGVESK